MPRLLPTAWTHAQTRCYRQGFEDGPAGSYSSGGDEEWHVLADPEGNEFRLLHARLDS